MTTPMQRNMRLALVVLAAVMLLAGAGIFSLPHTAASQASSFPINGYAWSDNIGWISLNCATGGPNGTNICTAGPKYGLSIDGSGNVTGYAWSDNIGWIQFGNLSGPFPTGSGTSPQNAQLVAGNLIGWARVCGGMDDQSPNQSSPNDTCTNGAGSRTDGWDGWISLNGGTGTGSYGPTTGGANECAFSGYAWGSDVVGWVDFEYASTTINSSTNSTCGTNPSDNRPAIVTTTVSASCNTTVSYQDCPSLSFCPSSTDACIYTSTAGTITVTPSLVQSGKKTTVAWHASPTLGCKVNGNGDSWSSPESDTGSPPSEGSQLSKAISQQVTYTLSCAEDDMSQPNFVQTATVNIAPSYQEQ